MMTMTMPRRQLRQRGPLVLSTSSNATSLSSIQYVRLFLIVFIAQSFEIVQGSSNSIASTTSPIRNWDPSWAASCAQSTVVAVSYPMKAKSSQDKDGHGVVLLMRSPTARKDAPSSTTTSPPNTDGSTVTTAVHVDGLRVFPHSTNIMTAADSSRRWTPIGPSAICCMTGLASDVDYLSRTLQKQANVHRTIYESNHALQTLKVVKNLAELLQDAVQWKEGRPFGVQALVVGLDRTPSTTRLNLFSLDPSGGFRHWGSATAIGRGAQQVRKRLYESLVVSSKNKEEAPSNGKKALEEALKACMTAMREASHNLDSDQYQALFVWTEKDGQMRVATIDPDQVHECQQMLQKELESPEKTKS
jgi:20S proteasome alpha/beta subunit